MIILAIILILFALFLAYLFCIGGRTSHRMLPTLRNFVYAHRGLHDKEKPENSMAAFRAALDHGYGVELDIHLLKDGGLAVIHDSSLQRTVGMEGRVEDLQTGDLAACKLQGTEETIPQFQQVLDLFAGKTPLIVELKCENGNHAALCQAACKVLDAYDGPYCMESFDPRAVAWLRKNRPDICRGQLSENWTGKKMAVPGFLKWALTYHISNVYTRPDFIAYKYADRKAFGTDICRKLLGVQGVSWTLKTKEEFDIAVSDGWIPIFEDFTV